MAKTFIIFILVIFLGALIFEVNSFWKKKTDLEKEVSSLRETLKKVSKDQEVLRSDLDYYLNPNNFEKEVKSRFNYKEEGEKFIILVPRNSSSSEINQ